MDNRKHQVRIWKHSHGLLSFTEEERDKYLRDTLIVIYAGYKQGHDFKNTMRVGDWFYLCHGNRGGSNGIQLLGRVSSRAVPFQRRGHTWLKRKYEFVKWRITRSGHMEDKRAWAPGGDTTSWLVPQNSLNDFERKILKPFFRVHFHRQQDGTIIGLQLPIDRAPHRQNSDSAASKQPSFSPEFSGHKKYKLSGEVEVDCTHGAIIQNLRDELSKRNHVIANDRRDLYVLAPNGCVSVLFELKTRMASTDIYQAVGQLMFHGALSTPPPRRVFVAPSAPDRRTKAALKKLGISVVLYRWRRQLLNFEGLDEALQ